MGGLKARQLAQSAQVAQVALHLILTEQMVAQHFTADLLRAAAQVEVETAALVMRAVLAQAVAAVVETTVGARVVQGGFLVRQAE